jgi:hypothetical protein
MQSSPTTDSAIETGDTQAAKVAADLEVGDSVTLHIRSAEVCAIRADGSGVADADGVTLSFEAGDFRCDDTADAEAIEVGNTGTVCVDGTLTEIYPDGSGKADVGQTETPFWPDELVAGMTADSECATE